MSHFEVQHKTLCDGWINVSMDDEGKPITFKTKSEADLDLKEHMHAMRDAVDRGDMEPHDPDDWRVAEVEDGQ